MTAVRDGAYRRELLAVRSGFAKARADAERLDIELERTVLRAPFSGVVTRGQNRNERTSRCPERHRLRESGAGEL